MKFLERESQKAAGLKTEKRKGNKSMKTYNETYVKFTINGEEAKATEKKFDKLVEEAQASGDKIEKQRFGTFICYEAETPEDFEQLVPDGEERVNIFNRGYVLKQQAIEKALLDESDVKLEETPFDLREEAASRRERRKADPQSKAKKQLDELDNDELAKVLAAYMQQRGLDINTIAAAAPSAA